MFLFVVNYFIFLEIKICSNLRFCSNLVKGLLLENKIIACQDRWMESFFSNQHPKANFTISYFKKAE